MSWCWSWSWSRLRERERERRNGEKQKEKLISLFFTLFSKKSNKKGVAGLQSVVLYALPELDGAIDALPLGGLVNGDIFLVRERVRSLAARVSAWVKLRRTPASERRVAAVVYGFPPGVGATGTAALLDVPKSIDAIVAAMDGAGYDLGPRSRVRRMSGSGEGSLLTATATAATESALLDSEEEENKWHGVGQAVIDALASQLQPRTLARGAAGVLAAGVGGGGRSDGGEEESHSAAHFGAVAAADDVPASKLREWLSFPASWGPTEWGPIPFLPPNDILVRRMEANWGDLSRQTAATQAAGLPTSGDGTPVAAGVELGLLRFGVQPALGVEGDPMRLLFDRDLTPHPSYAAFYLHLKRSFKADALVHLGMHGTVEWLPGAPLGSTALSWPDVLLGNLPNAYIYAANNPSESIVAKRRGFGTLVSYNVPPYGKRRRRGERRRRFFFSRVGFFFFFVRKKNSQLTSFPFLSFQTHKKISLPLRSLRPLQAARGPGRRPGRVEGGRRRRRWRREQ